MLKSTDSIDVTAKVKTKEFSSSSFWTFKQVMTDLFIFFFLCFL